MTFRDVLDALFKRRLNIADVVQVYEWIAPALGNSWVNYNAAVFNPAGFYKDHAGRVHLRGLIMNGAASAAIFTLPEGYRPERREVFGCAAYNGAAHTVARLDVETSGVVSVVDGAGGQGTWVSLDGISFLAHQ